jgi:hypothetical protein
VECFKGGTTRVVPHRSTTPARTCLTSLFEWEAVSQADMAALNLIEEKQSPSHHPFTAPLSLWPSLSAFRLGALQAPSTQIKWRCL